MATVVSDSKNIGTGRNVCEIENSQNNGFSIEIDSKTMTKIKFLCQQKIPHSKVKEITSFRSLLENLNFSSFEEHSDACVELFGTIQRYDLLRKLGTCQHQVPRTRNFIEQDVLKMYEGVERVEIDKEEDVKTMLIPLLSNYPSEKKEEMIYYLKDLLGEQSRTLENLLENERAARKHQEPKPKERYKINKGLCLIINNENFTEKEKRRIGTKKDGETLEKLFQEFNFTVETENDLTASNMKNRLLEEVARKDKRNFDLFVCFILSHGVEGKVLGTDDVEVTVWNELVKPFCERAKPFTGKPKLFFIQACQGDTNMRPEKVYPSLESDSIPGCSSDLQTDHFNVQSDGHDCSPSVSDFYIAFSSVPGYVSYRHPEKGTWFINAFYEIFSADGSEEHVDDLMTDVRNKVSKCSGKLDGELCMQAPCDLNALRKRVLLPRRE